MTDTHHTSARPFWWLVLALVGLQWISRFGPAPVVDFSLDDWSLLAHAASGDPRSVLQLGLHDADRPIGSALLVLFYRAFGDHPLPYALFSMAGFSLMMVLFLLLMRELTGPDLRAPLAAGSVLALWPTLTESFAWPVASAYALAFVGYIGAALCWSRFLRLGRGTDFAGLGLFYFFALFQYEVGLALPAAFAVLAWSAPPRRRWAGLALIGGLTIAYLTWRFTRGFGTAPGVYFPARRPGLSVEALLWNARETALWWVGPRFWACLTNGWEAFGRLPARGWFAWVALSAGAALGLAHLLRRSTAGRASGAHMLFFLAWFLGALTVSLPSWNCGRLNLLPAIGLAGLLGLLATRIDLRHWQAAVAPLAALALLANQGTALEWKEAGALQRQLLESLRASEPQWRDMDLLLFDSTQLRQRQTRGLNPEISDAQQTWAYWGNAGLLRGFGLSGMVDLVATQSNRPTVLLDVEGFAQPVGTTMVWHPRFNPSGLRTTALDRVWRVDALTGRPPRP